MSTAGELDAARQPVGNGAYVLKDRVVNEKLVVVPNTHYWDNAKTVIQQVTFVPINRVRRHQALSCRGYRYHRVFPENMYQKLLKDIPGQVYTRRSWVPTITLSIPKRPTADERVRLALSMTIDRRVMAEKVLGPGKPAGASRRT